MFGNDGNQMAHMVGKHQWDKISKKLNGADTQARISLASACGSSSDEEASNVLINLLQDSDESVQLQAVKPLGLIGHDNAKTHLQWLAKNLKDGQKELGDAINEAAVQISKRK